MRFERSPTSVFIKCERLDIPPIGFPAHLQGTTCPIKYPEIAILKGCGVCGVFDLEHPCRDNTRTSKKGRTFIKVFMVELSIDSITGRLEKVQEPDETRKKTKLLISFSIHLIKGRKWTP